MTDDRGRLSPSDELLREALQRVKDGELDSDDFVRTPRGGRDGTDGYGDPSSDVTPDDARDADGADLSAGDIAEELAEAHAAAGPNPEGAGAPTPEPPAEGRGDDTRAGMDSLPEWAFDEEPPAPASDGKQTEPTALNASTGPLVDRIRTLSGEQTEPPHPAPPVEIERDPWTTPSPEWEARSEPESRRSISTSWIRPVIALVVFGVMGIGFLVGQFDGRESIEDVAVGDCFDIGERGEIYDVPIVDCSELHDAELFATVQIDGLGSTYPGHDPINEWVSAVCEDRFPAYVGQPYRESPYWIETLVPTEDGWSEGDRIGMCTVVLVDEDLDVRKSLGSAKGWGERT